MQKQLPYNVTKTRKEVAKEYNVSRSTLYRWLHNAGLKFTRSLLKPKDLQKIYQCFGYPGME